MFVLFWYWLKRKRKCNILVIIIFFVTCTECREIWTSPNFLWLAINTRSEWWSSVFCFHILFLYASSYFTLKFFSSVIFWFFFFLYLKCYSYLFYDVSTCTHMGKLLLLLFYVFPQSIGNFYAIWSWVFWIIWKVIRCVVYYSNLRLLKALPFML